ncbi:hypothetical protein GH714_030785 [Hevea brasiliensis]|uniref:Retrotransposon gag domain-containing protein n=1 Tax=Hevea brasiliensis TaxID=3981 RepID=A0A6A6N9E8_HEVBR|nr:hypothetical protein GH714_030785 [Hevea brasiliensis]
MADQSEITLGVGVATMSVEHKGGKRKGRGKSRETSRAREDLGDLEKRLAKVELHLVDGEEKFKEMDTRLVELDGSMEELQGDMQGALNAAIDKLASEGESLRLSQMGKYVALRDENRSLKEQLDKVVEENSYLRRELDQAMGKLKEVEQQVSLVAMAVARGGVSTASGASLVIPSRVEVLKPSVYSSARNAKEIDNFLWSVEQYFRRHGNMEKGLSTIASWDEFKRELKRAILPGECRARSKGQIEASVTEGEYSGLRVRDRECGEGATFCPNQGGRTRVTGIVGHRGIPQLPNGGGSQEVGHPYEKETGWLKAVNSTPNLIHGVARDVKVRIGDWHGSLDFFIVSMDDYQCVLGVEFVDRAKAIPMLFANSMCITEGGGTCVVPLLRGKASNTLATMHVEMHDPSSAARGEKQLGKRGGTLKKDPKECKRGHTPKLRKGQPQGGRWVVQGKMQ